MNEEFEQVVVNHTHSVEQLKTCFDEFCRTVEKNELFQPGDILEWKPGWKQIQNVDGPFVVLPRVDEFHTHNKALLLGAINAHGQFELHYFRKHYFRTVPAFASDSILENRFSSD